MKKHYRKFCINRPYNIVPKSIILASLLVCSKSFSQDSFQITPELSKQVVEKNAIRNLNIYPVIEKEIEYYGYEDGEVLTDEYKSLQQRISSYKPDYDAYMSVLKESQEKKDVIKTISKNIDSFLNSKEKDKEKYLLESQTLAEKYDIRVDTKSEDKSFKSILNKAVNNDNLKPMSRTIKLMDNGKRANNSDLKIYQSEISYIEIEQPQQTYNYLQYLEYLKDTVGVKKKEMGKVRSNNLSKRKALIIGENPIELSSLSRNFTQLENQYMLAKSDITDKFIKNEIATEERGHYSGQLSTRFPVIKDENGKLYYIMSDSYLSELRHGQKMEELLNMVHKLGYKEYKDGEDYFIKSKTSEIKLDLWTYQELKKNPNYISNLDNDQIKLSELSKQTVSHSQTLDKYLSQYRIQRNKMPTTSLNAWKTATTSAQKMLTQINKVAEKYEGNYSFRPSKKSNDLDFFLDNLNASKGVLGM